MLFEEFRMNYRGKNTKFVVLSRVLDVMILDHEGNNYGAWFDVASFKKFVRAEPERDWNVGGKVALSIVVL